MRFFFRSKQFRNIILVVLALVALSVTCITIGSRISPQADIAGTITAPFRYIANMVSGGFSDLSSAFSDGNDILIENAELEAELDELRKKVVELERLQADNEFYKQYLEIKDEHPDFSFTPAIKISRDKLDPYKSFTINKGSANGVKENDPVITSSGLVGYVSEVGLTTAKVSTILSPDITLGALDNRTYDSGIVSGELSLAADGKTRFFNLSRSCNIAIGDYVVTSGEGIFPKGLLIGSVETIGSDEYNTSIYASIKPFADIENLREVMVITDFDGKGGLKVGSEE